MLADFFPALKFVPTSAARTLKKYIDEFNVFIYGELKRHRDSFHPGILNA